MMRTLLATFVALCLFSGPALANAISVEVHAPCEVADQAAYDAFEPKFRVREPRLDAFGFTGEVRGPSDGRVVIQMNFGHAVAWYDAPGKAKVIHKASGETRLFIHRVNPGKTDSILIVLSDGKIQCGQAPTNEPK